MNTENSMLIVDAHEDLAWNMLTFGRDYNLSADQTRKRELGTQIAERNGDTLLGWPEYQRGRVALVFSTLFASPVRKQTDSWDSQSYKDISEARILYSRQLDVYHRLTDEHPDHFRLVGDQKTLGAVLADWADPSQKEHPVGLVPLMEGAEALREAQEVEDWWERGVRIIGPAWAGNHFCGGTAEPGPLTRAGYELLEHMEEFGFILDISHMDEPAALQAIENYPGRVIASHANAKALLKESTGNRHLTDRVIRALLEREAVIGVVPMGMFIKADWKTGEPRSELGLERVVAQIEYTCQMAGSARAAGLGTDFDGGFGLQSAPVGIDTIADLHKLAPMLAAKGYTQADIAGILGGNWISLLQDALPVSA